MENKSDSHCSYVVNNFMGGNSKFISKQKNKVIYSSDKH